MSQDQMRVNFNEADIAKLNTTVQGFIDDFWASIDTNYTPTAIELTADLKLTVQNAGGTQKEFPLYFYWFEDASVQNTRMKNIFAAFTAGITAMEGASSYTTIISISGVALMKVTYS